ncbi:hypothetical protein ES689_07600 [Frigoribacterium sp. ACAM 257]|uniref:hypothetical protein n=1 Tax=Frigoribacterium sp. ACAM 257 TaxID=2508998 RepID=UPI0011B9D4DF|nr:hypothetical protein [Frigoribacterium sp. ACAM 257]TWX38493.1 hypothetical protein ES689_07600 [Frigoribacterium sp. ACAM 257]
MDVEPPTGDDLNRMLVSMKQDVLRRAAAEPPARRRPWARRHLGLTLGLVALLGIGGAGGALALVLPSPFRAAPAATPSPTSEPTREPVPGATATVSPAPVAPSQPVIPTPALGIDCTTLGERIGVAALVPEAAVTERIAPHFSAVDASLLQEGVLECRWTAGGDEYATEWAIVRVSPDAARGTEWLSGLTQSGLPSLDVGDVSAVACRDGSYSCNSSIVSGPWWFEVSASSELPDTITPALLRAAAQDVADVVGAAPPASAWTAPTTMWSSMTDCSAMPSAGDIDRLVGAPGLAGPEEVGALEQTGIHLTQSTAVSCNWSVPPVDDPTVELAVPYITLEVVPGGGWAYGNRTYAGSPVDVAGAESATAVCYSGEGSSCWIDALVDDTWIQVVGGPSPEHQDLLIAVTEAIIAAQAASAGRG